MHTAPIPIRSVHPFFLGARLARQGIPRQPAGHEQPWHPDQIYVPLFNIETTHPYGDQPA